MFKRTFSALALSAVMGLTTSAPVFSDGLAGAYLAARNAGLNYDFVAASQNYTRALAQDPDSLFLMDGAILSLVGAGKVGSAIPVARRLQSLNPKAQIANMLLLTDVIADDDFDAAFDTLEKGETVGPLVDGLVLAWVQLGLGRMSEALGSFEAVGEGEGLQAFGLYHKALALAVVGDLEAAENILSGGAGITLPATRRGTIVHLEILSQLERNDDAIKLINSRFGEDLDPSLAVLLSRLKAGETLPLATIRNPKDGIAEVFFSVAGALVGEAHDGHTLIYTRVTEYLRPDHVDSILLTAQLLERLGRYELATAEYDAIPDDSPAFYAAELGRVEAMREAGDLAGGIAALETLAAANQDQADVHIKLGDFLRRRDDFEEAAASYSNAINLFTPAQEAHWPVFYARGIMYERSDNWENAEADFRRALELSPDQPQVLNYLGYSFVEMKTNMDEALAMIQTAVAGRPDDAYITDSLGWVFYRLGRYSEAVEPMERAAALAAVDPVVNDHLGDVYWSVGRTREAEFQWYRALSFEPEDKDATRIRRKLKVGLDVVLDEEGGDPIRRTNDG